MSNQEVVVRFCEVAKAGGVNYGMSLQLALALCPTSEVVTFNFDRQLDFLNQLGRWATNFAPLVAKDVSSEKIKDPHLEQLYDGLLLDLSGTERLYKSGDRLLKTIQDALASLRLDCNLAIAPTIGAAWALSRFGPKNYISKNIKDLVNDLAPLPLAGLRIEQSLLDSLYQFGFEKIGQLIPIPPKVLLKRFDYSLIRKLNLALGKEEEGFNSLPISKKFIVRKSFEIPISCCYTLLALVLKLLKNLLALLENERCLALSYQIQLEGVRPVEKQSSLRNFEIVKEFSLVSASSSLAEITTIISPFVENLSLQGEVHSIAIEARSIKEADALQGSFLKESSLNYLQTLGGLLNLISNRIGRERIRQIEYNNSYVPEKTFSTKPISSLAFDDDLYIKQFPLVKERPSLLLREPRPISAIALLPDNPPAWIEWNGLRSTILVGIGPEIISEEWWQSAFNSSLKERQYFKVQESRGIWLWIFRSQPSGEWFLHGVWA